MPEGDAGGGRVSRRRFVAGALFVAAVIVPLVAVALRSTWLARPGGEFLEIEMRATGGSAAQLFWSQDFAFYHARSTVVPLHRRPGQFETLRFPLPDRRLESLRFDPLDGPGEVEIRSVRVTDAQGRLVRSIDPLQFMPLYQIARQAYEEDGHQVRIVTTAGALDPMLLLNAAALTAPPRWYELTTVTPFWLTWVALAAAALIATAIACVAREIRRGPVAPRHLVMLAAVFVTIVAAKLLLLRHYPMPVPFWDQWDGEGLSLYLPYSNGTLAWRQMFTFHNEHRIFFTRVLAVALVALNHQWDPHLQMAVNAVLHATAATVLAAACWLALGRRWLLLIAAGVLLAVAPPFAIENSLAGFQSAFFFLVLFTVLAVWLMTANRPGSPAWAIGWLCALASVYTVAGGILVAAALAVNAALRFTSAPALWRRSVLEFAAIGAVAVAGYYALPPPLAAHEHLRAESRTALLYAFTHGLAFPWILRLKPAGLMWLPVAGLGLFVLRRRLRASIADRWTLALAAWVLAQAAAIAVSRGVGGNPPASRYLDMLALSLPVNLCAVLLLAGGEPGTRRTAARVAGTAWIVLAAIGVSQLSVRMTSVEAALRRDWMRHYVRNITRFLTSQDYAWFLALPGPLESPYSRPPLLAGMLSHPYFRNLMPAAIRPPLVLRADEAVTNFEQAASGREAAPIWVSVGTRPALRTFTSLPVQCALLPYLALPVTGGVGHDGLRLQVRETSGEVQDVRVPADSAGWTTAIVRCPSGTFTVEATDASPWTWLAFKQPAEMGWASALTERLLVRAPLLLLLGLGLCAAAVTLELTATSPAGRAPGGSARKEPV